MTKTLSHDDANFMCTNVSRNFFPYHNPEREKRGQRACIKIDLVKKKLNRRHSEGKESKRIKKEETKVRKKEMKK